MGQTLKEIAQKLSAASKKVQLIYAFNGVGKTRLSREFKELVAPKASPADEGDSAADQPAAPRSKILYYNAFTEDLFYWDNDLQGDAQRRLIIQPNSFTDWVLNDQGQDQRIVATFQRYTNDKLTPRFAAEDPAKGIKAFSQVTFSMQRGDDESSDNLKISKGEESCFIWSIFFALLEQVIEVLKAPAPAETDPDEFDDAAPQERETSAFDNLKYVFIDDPVSSLDENHLIELAVNLASLIKSSPKALKFIITTHSTLFYNVLYNELNKKICYLLDRLEDGTYILTPKNGDSNTSFSYHLHLMHTIEQAIAENRVERYHFTLLRNLYEKTASFLGYPQWSDLLPQERKLYLDRILNFTSHSTLSNEAFAEPTQPEKATVKFLLDHLKTNHRFWQKEEQHG